MTKFFKLADPKARLPMPDRGGRLFGVDGQFIDQHAPFYRTAILQGDLVKADPPASADDDAVADTPETDTPAKPKGDAGKKAKKDSDT